MRDHYIGAEILLPREDEMARGCIVAWSHNANRNIIGRTYTNPIFNGTYQVAFTVSNITELATNIIAESMHAQCDAERNEYFLLDVLVDYH